MKRILSFGGGLQTTAMAIMVANGELEVNEFIFADTGAEKPETYWYIENYIKPMLKIPFVEVKSHLGFLYEYCWQYRIVPIVIRRWCTDKFKIRPIRKHYKNQDIQMIIGFSFDESDRAERGKGDEYYPLIEKQMTTADCVRLIQAEGLPVPCRSSCYFCVFQPLAEWNWLKLHHPDLVRKAMALEAEYYKRYPQHKELYGLLKGTPLWKWGDGVQSELLFAGEKSCWSGHCGH